MIQRDNADPMNDVEEFGAATDDSERQGLIQELVSPPQPQDGPSAEEAPFETFAEALAKDTLLGAPKAPPPNATPQDEEEEFTAPPPPVATQPDQDGQPVAPPVAPPVGPPGFLESALPANQVHTGEEAEAVWSAVQAGSVAMRHGLEKMRMEQYRRERRREQYTSKSPTILEDGDVVESTRFNQAVSESMKDRLGDCRSQTRGRRPATQRAPDPHSAGTASDNVTTSVTTQQAPHPAAAPVRRTLASFDEPRQSDEPFSDFFNWIKKWKGLKPDERVPACDKERANRFQQDEDSANARFEQDLLQNDGDPKFLRNQLTQKWVVPWWKSEATEPMAFCCICGKEAWTPVHFYSREHLKNCLSTPQNWEATWKYPKKCFTSVFDFNTAVPEFMCEESLMDLQDCPQNMSDWAQQHLKLSKKPHSGEASSSKQGNQRVSTGDMMEILDGVERRFDDTLVEIVMQLDVSCTQIDHQGKFIEYLEGQYKNQMSEQSHSGVTVRELCGKQGAENHKLWHEISTLKDTQKILDQKIVDLEQKILEKKSPSSCFSGVMSLSWCRH